MKVITLHEPWATLMAIGAKKIETRHWPTKFRGLVAIHAAKGGLGLTELENICREKYFFSALKAFEPFRETAHLLRRNMKGVFPRGHILAVGELVDCLPTEARICLTSVFDEWPSLDNPQERAFGNYEPGRFGFLFGNVRRLKMPVPFSSRQGKILELDAATEALVLEQLNG